ncbi:hypothetical protein GGD83_004100 [Rhodoblastus sphagnicola]|nr:hypothetical protein [Rhodoblastus sphagnicola]MBB4200271.1 hypothetical protein [Rhodoblastus sphagnicola]
MNPRKSKRDGGKMPMAHPNAAAIDIGAAMHMAVVGADRTPEPEKPLIALPRFPEPPQYGPQYKFKSDYDNYFIGI